MTRIAVKPKLAHDSSDFSQTRLQPSQKTDNQYGKLSVKANRSKPYDIRKYKAKKKTLSVPAKCFRCGDDRHSLQRCRCKRDFKSIAEIFTPQIIEQARQLKAKPSSLKIIEAQQLLDNFNPLVTPQADDTQQVGLDLPVEDEMIEYLPFAQCNLCSSKGHISMQCLLNKEGYYPNGGACHRCGRKRHLASDCPYKMRDGTDVVLKQQKSNTIYLEKINFEHPDSNQAPAQRVQKAQTMKKVVKF